MSAPKIVPLETHADERGELTTLSLVDGCVPFTVKRMFYIYGVPLRAMPRRSRPQDLRAVSDRCLWDGDDKDEQSHRAYPI